MNIQFQKKEHKKVVFNSCHKRWQRVEKDYKMFAKTSFFDNYVTKY